MIFLKLPGWSTRGPPPGRWYCRLPRRTVASLCNGDDILDIVALGIELPPSPASLVFYREKSSRPCKETRADFVRR
jgi:hypothetical protein